MVDEDLDRLSDFRYRDRAEALDAVFSTLSADSFGRVRSSLASLESFEGSLLFVL